VNSLRRTVTRQRHDCDLNPGPLWHLRQVIMRCCGCVVASMAFLIWSLVEHKRAQCLTVRIDNHLSIVISDIIPCTVVLYGVVNVDLYSAIITKVSNALNTLVSGEKPGFQALSKGLIVLLCAVNFLFVCNAVHYFCNGAVVSSVIIWS